jgi:glycosyltransferase involved in cell wall biosynthesis
MAPASKEAGPGPGTERTIECLLVSPSDPLTRGPRAGPLRRLMNPPEGVNYTLATDRFAYPARASSYEFNPLNVALVVTRFALEHAMPIDERGKALVHSFFWDVRKYAHRWVHESDQSFGQFLSGYNNVTGQVKKWANEGFSSYLNSRWCAGVVTWSEWAKEGFVEDGIDRSKISVIPPPFRAVDYRRAHEGCNALFLGRDFHRKGGDTVIRAFTSMKGQGGCRLNYIGPMEGKEAERAKADGRIIQRDSASTRDLLQDIWPATDIFVLPTRADAFAVTVVDAMRRGIPVVSTRIPAVSEVVEDGVSGFLSEVGDEDGVRENLERLVYDPQLRIKMGESAKRRAVSLFSPEKVNSSLRGVYLDAL